MKDYKKVLANTYLFKNNMAAAEQINLSGCVTFNKGDTVYDKKDFKRCIGIVLSGNLKALPLDASGTLSYFGESSIFGAAALFSDSQNYISRIEAVTQSEVLFINEIELRALFEKYPDIAVNFMSFLTDRIRFLNERLALMMRDRAEGKLYDFLCKNGGYEGKMTGLASLLGMGRTSLYRAIENLEHKKMIIREDNKIKVIA